MPNKPRVWTKSLNVRSIKTTFYHRSDIVKTTSSRWAETAVPNAVKHLQINQYGATHCEVFDIETGLLYAVVKYHIGTNRIEILYKREIRRDV